MYQLLRVHLESVGHADARFDPLTLDLRFATGEPAPESVVWLRNGGGKTSLLSLIFSLVQPRQSDFMGRRSSRKGGKAKSIEDYVQRGDVAHVVAEWGPPPLPVLPGLEAQIGGERLVTGQALAWHTQGGGESLARVFYAFRPQPGALELEHLPFSERRGDKRRRTPHNEFKARLRELGAACPRAHLTIIETQEGWREYLENARLDPELFRYQLAMNEHEGGAEDFLTFKDGDSFVEFLLRLVTDPARANGVRHNIDEVADQIARRFDLQRELDFVAGVHERTPLLLGARDALAAARSELDEAQVRARGLARRVSAAASAAEKEKEVQAAAADRADAACKSAEGEQKLWTHRIACIESRLAGCDLQDAERTLTEAKGRADELARLVEAWSLSPRQHERRSLQAEARALREAFSLAEQDAAGQKQAYAMAAAQLRARLASLIAAQTAAIAATEGEQKAAEAQYRAAGRRDVELAERAAKLGGEQKHLREQLERVDRERERLTREGVLAADEAAAAALLRLERAGAAVEERARAAEAQEAELKVELASLRASAVQCTQEEARSSEQLRALGKRRAALAGRLESLAADPLVQALLGQGTLDLVDQGVVLYEGLSEHAAEGDRAMVAEEVDLSQTRRALESLQSTGLMPPSRDVEAGLQALARAGLPAVSGWQFLATNVRESERERLLSAHPELADGVVVNDGRLQRAASVLRAGLAPTHPLVLAESAAWQGAADDESGAAHVLVIPGSPAHYEAAAAETARGDCERRLAAGQARCRELQAEATRARELCAQLEALRREEPDGLRGYDRQIAGMVAELAALQQRQATVAERIEIAEQAQRAAAETLRACAAESTVLARQQTALGRFAPEDAQYPDLQRHLELAGRELQAVMAQRQRCQKESATAWDKAEAARARAQAASSGRAQLQTQLAAVVGAEGEVADDVCRPLEVLEYAYAVARDEYERKTVRSETARRLQQVEESLARLNAELGQKDPDLVRLADAVIDGPQWSAGAAREAAERRARNEQAAAQEAVGACAQTVKRARAEVETRQQALAGRTEALPWELPVDTREAAETSLSEANRRQADASRSRAAAETARASAKEAAAAAREAANAFNLLGKLLRGSLSGAPAGDEGNAPLAPITTEEANDAVETATAAVQQAKAAVERAKGELDERVKGLRRFVQQDVFGKVSPALRSPYGEADDEGLAARVAEHASDIQKRAEWLPGELERIEQHRRAVAAELRQLVAEAFKVLDDAQRFKLPEGLSDWSGQQYLHIKYARPDAELLTRRVDGFVDDLIRMDPRPEGVTLLVKAVLAAVGGQPFLADVLKPNQNLPRVRESVAVVASWSGGQKLTTALLLYCALIRLRAESRPGRAGARASVLILDNPIGAANHVDFVDLQLKMAELCHVQLVITTGIKDFDALAAYSKVIRLANEQADRSALRYVRADAADGDAEEPRPSSVSGAQVYRPRRLPAEVAG